MSTSVAAFDTSLDAVVSAVEALPTNLAVVRGLDDAALLRAQHRLAAARTTLDACASLLAGETGYRSRHDLGLKGLAQREGFRTPKPSCNTPREAAPVRPPPWSRWAR
jgi:hypothetical protein